MKGCLALSGKMQQNFDQIWQHKHYLRPRKKRCCVALSDRPYSKIKIKKSRVGKAPNFAQIGCFLRKMMEYAPKFGPFGCFLKKL